MGFRLHLLHVESPNATFEGTLVRCCWVYKLQSGRENLGQWLRKECRLACRTGHRKFLGISNCGLQALTLTSDDGMTLASDGGIPSSNSREMSDCFSCVTLCVWHFTCDSLGNLYLFFLRLSILNKASSVYTPPHGARDALIFLNKPHVYLTLTIQKKSKNDGEKTGKNLWWKFFMVLNSLTCDFHHRLVFFLLFFTGSLCATVRPEFFFKAKNVEKSPPFWTLTFDLDLQGVTRYTQDTYPDQVSSRSPTGRGWKVVDLLTDSLWTNITTSKGERCHPKS